MPNVGHFRGVGRDGHEMLGDRLLVAPSALQQPVAGGVGVGHRFQRRERLGRDDEQRFRRVEIVRGFGEIGAVDVGDEAERQVAVAVSAAALRRP